MKHQGFSLLELLVALTILAIALIPVSYFYTKSLQNAEQAGIRTRALQLAWERVNEIRALAEHTPDAVLPNTRPTNSYQKTLYGPNGLDLMDDYGPDVFGYDFAAPLTGALHPAGQWVGMFRYPLPLDFNPYDLTTQGYDNSPNRTWVPNNPTNDPNVNFNSMLGNWNGGYDPTHYEYEPIGFYNAIYRRNQSLTIADAQDIRMADSRTISAIEPSLANGDDFFRTGNDQQLDNYSIYGRRTIIQAYSPVTDPSQFTNLNSRTRDDDDGDTYWPTNKYDGGASETNPFTMFHGPADKFVYIDPVPLSKPGIIVTVVVFWLPRTAPEAYVPYNDLNKIEVKVHVADDGTMTQMENGYASAITDTSPFFISPAT